MSWWAKLKELVTSGSPRSMLRGIYPAGSSEPPTRGTEDLLAGYESMPWLRAVADKVGTAVGAVDWRLLAVSRNGKIVGEPGLQRSGHGARTQALKQLRQRKEIVEILDHPFLTLLDNPNPFMGRSTLLKQTCIHLDLVGDAYWLVDRDQLGTASGAWPIPPHWVVETPTPQRPRYRIQWKTWYAEVPEREVVWFHEPAPQNPYARGTGVGWSIGDELEVDEYASKLAKQFFWNRARPDFVVMGGEGSSVEEIRRLERDWNQRNQGFWKAHKPYFMAGKVDIHEFQQPTMEQLVYPNLRKVQRDIVLQTWGIPPELLGIVENSNRATIEAAEYLFARWVVQPRCERIRSTVQRFVVTEYDGRAIVDYESPVEEDKAQLLDAAKAAPWALTVNEWRRLQHLPPTPEGDVYLVPLNSYVTADPEDPATRPAAGGAAAPTERPN